MRKLLFLTLAATIGFGCSEDECGPVGTTDDNVDEIKITALIADVQPLLKTTIDGAGKASWTTDDAFGLFCAQSKLAAANNVKVTYDGTNWAAGSTLYWSDASTPHTFLAYAPYAEGNTATAAKLPALNSQNGTITPAQDFLIATPKTQVRSAGTSVALTFTHALSLIEFKVKTDASIAASTTLENFVLTGGSSDKIITSDANSTIDLSTAAITLGSGTANTVTVTPVSKPVLTTTAPTNGLYALILPSGGTPYTAMNLVINIKEGGTTIAVPSVAVGTLTFAPGTKYTYTVTVSRTAITISAPIITDWTPGTGGNINPGI